MLTLNSLAIGAASLFVVVAANHGHDLHARSHHHDVVERSEHLNIHQKRFSGTATYYLTGLGACGIYNNPSDKIVALNSAQYGGGYPGPNCFKSITICKGSVCHGAQITDECPTCDYGSLDLSQGLFEQFANTDDGVFQMTWTFNDGNDEPKTTTTKKPDTPKTTKQPETTKEPEPTTTWEPPATTSTKKRTTTSPPPETTSTPEPTTSTTSSTPQPTSTSEARTSTSSTSAAISTTIAPSTVANSSAAPTATAGSGSSSNPGSSASNLQDANMVMLALGKMAVVANGGA